VVGKGDLLLCGRCERLGGKERGWKGWKGGAGCEIVLRWGWRGVSVGGIDISEAFLNGTCVILVPGVGSERLRGL